ncbi:MAG: hypothetical protein ACI4DS_01805, partial [Eubacterium sp.]
MRILRRIVVTLFILSVALFAAVSIHDRAMTDNTYPEIKSNSDVLELSINAEDDQLLSGLTAWDDKDGDLTDKIFVENISKFTDIASGNITYAVVDSDNHIAKYTR